MKNSKNKKIITIVLVIVLGIVAGIFTFSMVNKDKIKGDSGFDSSYDSGSSFDSGSSWDSGSSHDSNSSWDSDSSWDDSDSSYGSSGAASSNPFLNLILIVVEVGVIFFITIIFIIIVGVYVISKTKKNNNKEIIPDKSSELSDEEIRKYIPNFNKEIFLTERYRDFVDVQNSWMNFDYDKLKEKLTDELYNQYAMQLDTLKIKKKQNIMNDFIYKDSIIKSISEENKILTMEIILSTSFYDYITDEFNNVVRGNKNKKLNNCYKLTFICNLDSKDVCPTCGAELNDNALQMCEYCHNTITNISKKWILSKKEIISQR